MAKTTKKSKITQVQFGAKIITKFDLLAVEPEMGFYYLNLYAQCQKAQVYWCYIDEPGAIMRFNQRQIARKNPPHLNLALPPRVDALTLQDLVAGLDTSLFLDPQKYFCKIMIALGLRQ